MNALPVPACELGYTQEQLVEILGDRLPEFNKWMVGQTAGICDGRSYDHEKQQYNETGCGPHGFITYSWDVQRFVDGKPIID